MKPKDLKSPFLWDERQVMVHDRVWYVPDYMDCYTTYCFPGWDAPELFGNSNPVKVEYCSGNGEWILNRALAEPDVNWVAVEFNFDRVRKIWSKIKNHGLDNLIVVSGEGYLTTAHYFPDSSVSEVYINFPDPWPKKRHWKHRIIQYPFVDQLNRILPADGIVTFVTDDADYSELTIEVFFSHEGFNPIYDDPYYKTDVNDYGNSWFEELWRGKGKTIRHHQFKK